MPELRGLPSAPPSAGSRIKHAGKTDRLEGTSEKIPVWGESLALAEAQETVAQEVAEEAGLVDALEVMSLNLSSKVKEQLSQQDRAKSARNRSAKVLKKLSKTALPDELQSALASLQGLSDFQEAEKLLEQQPPGAQMLCIARWLEEGTDSPEQQKALESKMDQLLSQPNWALEAMATLSLERVTLDEMRNLNAVYQKALDTHPDGNRLVEWFQSISHWERRGPKIQTLIRSLALELSIEYQGDRSVRMASTLHDLQKISQFLMIEDHAHVLENSFQLPRDTALQEILMMLDQPWVAEDWIQGRSELLGIETAGRPAYNQYMLELIELLPEACFEHELQRNQLMEAFEKLTASPSFAVSAQRKPTRSGNSENGTAHAAPALT